jgi:uncharacterized protein DUF4383
MQAPQTPAQLFAFLVGGVLVVFGVVALVVGHTDFGTGDNLGGDQFILWMANGWDTIVWIAVGALGVMAAGRADAARMYAAVAGAFFAVVAVWGFIDGNDVFGLMAVDTTDNISHAVLAALGLVSAMAPDWATTVDRGHPTHA